jgi:hypothetical protein
VPPTTTAPPAYKESPEQFKETGDNPPGEWTVAQPQDATLRGKWWEIYNEPDLNALEEQLNVDNQNIREAFENFMEARALVREARVAVFPHGERRAVLHAGRRLLPILVRGAIASNESGGKQSPAGRSFPCLAKFPGSPTCGAKFATCALQPVHGTGERGRSCQ